MQTGDAMYVEGIVKRFGELIEKAEKQIIEGISEERIETEEAVTNRFLEAVENVFRENGEHEGFLFNTRTLKDKGPGAAERKYGADFLGILNVRLEGYEQTKGFLSQAKMEGKVVKVQTFRFLTTATFYQNPEFERLKGQATDMLRITPDSFVTVYSKRGFIVVPASSVLGLSSKSRLYAKPFSQFFKEYLMSFIGDPRLRAWDNSSLEALRADVRARSAILFNISQTPVKKRNVKGD
jgi:hypothetical protein